jgi:hypothetical protein
MDFRAGDGYAWWIMRTDDGAEGWAVNIPDWFAPAIFQEEKP